MLLWLGPYIGCRGSCLRQDDRGVRKCAMGPGLPGMWPGTQPKATQPQVILPQAGPPEASVWTWVKIYPQSLRRLPGVLHSASLRAG